MKQVTDIGAIEKIVDEIVAESGQGFGCEDQSESDRLVCRTGDEVVRRQGNPQAVNDLLKSKLGI